MKENIILTIALILICCIYIFLLVSSIILVYEGQNPTYLDNKHKELRTIRRVLTKLPCLSWYKKIESEFGSTYYTYCQEDEDCAWFPSCEFGCHRSINSKSKNYLQEKILRWRKFCWQNNSCLDNDYSCSQQEVRCINYQCQTVSNE